MHNVYWDQCMYLRMFICKDTTQEKISAVCRFVDGSSFDNGIGGFSDEFNSNEVEMLNPLCRKVLCCSPFKPLQQFD